MITPEVLRRPNRDAPPPVSLQEAVAALETPTAPTTRIALAVDDHGEVEMQLILSQSG